MSGPGELTLPFRRAGVESRVEVEVGVNRDPAALGCPPCAEGFPFCRATVGPPARGYADWLGWVQMLEWELIWEGFQTDPFLPLGDGSHPFCFFGFSPTLFDAPHTDLAPQRSDFVAHSFLCGLGPETLGMRGEIDALLGFSWGFRIRDGEIAIDGPAPLDPGAWDRHRSYLADRYPDWSFLPGYAGA